ncbi:MAG TPA: HAD-IIB family hydrolase [Gammaproteobacteria bacterium]|nr:HAD-IIB family hydrolase [Gammaproteobacteria bacterium]
MKKLLLCCDLDRTLLSNGSQEESPQARPLFRAVARHPQLTLAYVSGRDKSLLLEAIRDYDLPPPDYAIGDVGTSIYEFHGDQWIPLKAWEKEIAPDWSGNRHDDLVTLFKDIDNLTLQEAEKQSAFKLSYYVPGKTERDELLAEMHARLRQNELRASLIWSIDEARHVGLLDVLPHRATKVHAIRFLMARTGFKEENTIFAGDSGNDLPVLTSGLKAVLVHNARREVYEEAMRSVCKQGFAERLYLAHGDFLGMNGNYAAGVLEGLVHFHPETLHWFKPKS